MKIALLIPSRERIAKKLELIDSIKNTVDNLDNIKLYFGIDLDDPTRKEVNDIKDRENFIEIVDIDNKGKYLNVGVMWNICARACNEEILSMIGDDMVFVTKGWDTKILDEFKPPNCPQDNFKMVHCYDGRHGARIAVNAFVHKVYMDINGYFMREEFPVDKIDIWLQQIFSAFGRLKYCGEIHIEHKHWSFRKSAVDDVARRMRANNAEQISTQLWSQLLPERIKEAEKISKKLGIPFNRSKINNDLGGG